MLETPFAKLPLLEELDHPSWLGHFNPAMTAVDEAVQEVADKVTAAQNAAALAQQNAANAETDASAALTASIEATTKAAAAETSAAAANAQIQEATEIMDDMRDNAQIVMARAQEASDSAAAAADSAEQAADEATAASVSATAATNTANEASATASAAMAMADELFTMQQVSNVPLASWSGTTKAAFSAGTCQVLQSNDGRLARVILSATFAGVTSGTQNTTITIPGALTNPPSTSLYVGGIGLANYLGLADNSAQPFAITFGSNGSLTVTYNHPTATSSTGYLTSFAIPVVLAQ
jgi:hypothetical protein